MADDLASQQKELWATFACCSCVLVLKMNVLAWITGRIRVARKVIHSEEDRVWLDGPDVILCPSGGGHEEVDRVRSAHRHDLETALLYLLIAPMWLITLPPFPLARLILPCFAIISVARTVLHMEIVSLHRSCKPILSALEYYVLTYMSVDTAFYYAF